jgi:hypothetical protein
MKTPYEVFHFQLSLGYAHGATLKVRVHAASRAAAWAKVHQMHPRAVVVQDVPVMDTHLSVPAKRDEVHVFQ